MIPGLKRLVENFQTDKARYGTESRHPSGKNLTLGNAQLRFVNTMRGRASELAGLLGLPDDAELWISLGELCTHYGFELQIKAGTEDANQASK